MELAGNTVQCPAPFQYFETLPCFLQVLLLYIWMGTFNVALYNREQKNQACGVCVENDEPASLAKSSFIIKPAENSGRMPCCFAAFHNVPQELILLLLKRNDLFAATEADNVRCNSPI